MPNIKLEISQGPPPLLASPLLLTDSDVPLACELFEQVFKHPISPAQWHWKYQEGPRLGKVHVGIKSAQGALIAHAGASVFEGRYKDANGQVQSLPMAQVCDVMVHESARNAVTHQGAYGQVIHALQTQLALSFPGVYAYGFAGIRPYKLGVKMGLYKCHQDCRMGQVQMQAHANAHAPANAHATEPSERQSIGAWLRSLFNSEKLTPLHFSAQEPASFQKYQAQFDEWAQTWGITDAPKVLRTAAYLQWRFVQNPNAQYQFWLYSKGGKNLAWCITREFTPGQITVVDALMHPELQQTILSAFQKQTQINNQLRTQIQSVSSWHIQTPESLKLEPIKACEVKVGDWHTCQPPLFWPADTDVF